MNVLRIPSVVLALAALSTSACHTHDEKEHQAEQEIIVTSPEAKDVTVTRQFVCQIHSQRHIEVCALESGYLQPIKIKEGQAVTENQVLFTVIPVLYNARLDVEKAEVNHAQMEYNFSKSLAEDRTTASGTGLISQKEVSLYLAKLKKAEAKLAQVQAELDFASVKASFDGIIDRLLKQQGSLLKEGDVLTTLSDNRVMWVYFNVPEARYFEYERLGKRQDNSRLQLLDSRLELMLADGTKFDQDCGNTVTVEGQFNNMTGNIAFRADFPNPDRILRHGQTGTMLVHRLLKNAIVIPQRATFELLGKRYVWVVDGNDVVHQRLITIENELEDVFVLRRPPTEAQIQVVLSKAKDLRSSTWQVLETAEKEVDLLIGKQYREAVQRAMKVVEGDEKKAAAARKILEVPGVDVNDKIVLEGVRQVEENKKIEYKFQDPEEALQSQKFRAE